MAHQGKGTGTPGERERRLLAAAERGGLVEVTKALEEGADPEAKDSLGMTPLCAAASGGHVEVLEYLLDQGADLHAETHADMTALHLAARDGRTPALRFLLERGAASSERLLDDVLTVATVSAVSNQEIIDLLEQWRARIATPAAGKEMAAAGALLDAAHTGDLDAAKEALDRGADPAVQDRRGMDSLTWASLGGHHGIVRLLLDHGADVNATNDADWTPLMQAAFAGHEDVVHELLERGAAVDAVTVQGITALMCAAHNGHAAIAGRLLDRGASITLQVTGGPDVGKTARDLAGEAGHSEIVGGIDRRSLAES